MNPPSSPTPISPVSNPIPTPTSNPVVANNAAHHTPSAINTPSTISIPNGHKDSEIRKHYFTEEHVIISPQSVQNKPINTTKSLGDNGNAAAARLDQGQKIIDAIDLDNQQQILSIENKYSALQISNNNAYGYEETIIDNTNLEKYFSSLTEANISKLIMMYKKRYTAIKNMKFIEYIQIFKNSYDRNSINTGYQQSQIIATHHIPNRVNYLQTQANIFFNQKYENPISAIINFENSSSVRIIEENINWISFCPYFSIYPLEVWILPKMPIQNIGQIMDSSIVDLVSIMHKVISRLDKNNIDYSYYFLNAISDIMSMQMHIVPRLSPGYSLGGYEMATSEYINYIFPEDAAKWYNNII